MFGLGGLGPRGSFILPAKGASVNRAAVLSCESWFKRPHQSSTRYSLKKEARALESAFNRDAVAHRLRSGRSGLCPLLRFSCSRSSSWGEHPSFSGGPQPNRTGRYPPAVLRTFHARPLRLPFRRVMRSRQTLLSRIAPVWRAVPDALRERAEIRCPSHRCLALRLG